MSSSVLTDNFRAWTETKPISLRNPIAVAEDVIQEYGVWCDKNRIYPLEAIGVGRAMRSVFVGCKTFQKPDAQTKIRKRVYLSLDRKPFVETPPEENEDLL